MCRNSKNIYSIYFYVLLSFCIVFNYLNVQILKILVNISNKEKSN